MLLFEDVRKNTEIELTHPLEILIQKTITLVPKSVKTSFRATKTATTKYPFLELQVQYKIFYILYVSKAARP